MKIDFNELQEIMIPCMNNETGTMTIKMYNDEKYRIVPTTIHSGGVIHICPKGTALLTPVMMI